MTLHEGILAGFAILWIVGWIATVRETSAAPGRSWVMGVLVLFVVWPVIAWAMATSRH